MKKTIELEFRKMICLKLIEMLQTDEELLADPRQPSALLEYQGQLARIQLKIDGLEDTRKLIGEKPAPTIVGLKTAKLFGEVQK